MSVCWIWATNIHVCRLNAVIAEGIIRRKKADAKPRCLATPSWREVNHLQTWPRPKPRFHDEKRHHDDTAQPIMHPSYDIYRVFCTPRFHGDYRHSWRSCEWMPCMPYFIGSKVCPIYRFVDIKGNPLLNWEKHGSGNSGTTSSRYHCEGCKVNEVFFYVPYAYCCILCFWLAYTVFTDAQTRQRVHVW